MEGRIVKALSGYYYVDTADGIVTCRARGRFRMDGTSPLVGDRVEVERASDGSGTVKRIAERRNWFIRPAVANLDQMVMVAAAVNPITEPFLIDRVSALAAHHDCEFLLCINKADLDPGDGLYAVYEKTGIRVLRTSAVTGEGLSALADALRDKVSAFTGNSGVGKSSILNVLLPNAHIETGEVSERLGRGRHTTRHVQLYALPDNTFAADTPGFASFEIEMMETIEKEQLQYDFIDFAPYIGTCRFNDCAHLKEPDCAVTRAVEEGRIEKSRYKSYVQLYELCAQHKPWEIK